MNLKPFYAILTDSIAQVPIFINYMPETVTEGILLIHTLSCAALDPSLPDYKKARIQIVVRATDFESGYALAREALVTFKVIKRHRQDGVFISFIEPLHDPIPFPASKGNYTEFSVNFETAYVEH